MATKKADSPNADIDAAIAEMMKSVKDKDPAKRPPPEVAVKIINTAIAWEKVKHNIKDDEPFDPDRL